MSSSVKLVVDNDVDEHWEGEVGCVGKVFDECAKKLLFILDTRGGNDGSSSGAYGLLLQFHTCSLNGGGLLRYLGGERWCR